MRRLLPTFLLLPFVTGCLFSSSVKEKECPPSATVRAAAGNLPAAAPTRVPCAIASLRFDKIVETPEPPDETEIVETTDTGERVTLAVQTVPAEEEDAVYRAIQGDQVLATAGDLTTLVAKAKEMCR